MKERFSKHSELIPFTQVANALLLDKKLKDYRLLYIAIAMKPDTWNFYVKQFCEEFGFTESFYRRGLQALERDGWISNRNTSACFR